MVQNEKTDEEIVSLIIKGNKDLFGEIIHRYEAKMRRYARKFLFDSEHTDDLVQEVFIKTYVNLQSFDNTQRFSPWIYRIAHNEFINALKKKLSYKIFSLDLDTFLPHPEAKETSDEETENTFTKEILDEHLFQIDSKYREALVLYFFEEMDYKEISSILGIPVSTVGVRIKRGKEKLKELLLINKFTYDK